MLAATDSVQYLRGVGPARARLLAELGVRTVGDLLFYFPRDLAHLPARQPIAACRSRIGQTITVAGVLQHTEWAGRPWKPIFAGRLTDQTGAIQVVWFNAGWIRGKVNEGDRLIAWGRLRQGRNGPQLANPKYAFKAEDVAAAREQEQARWEPVYPASVAITSQQIRKIIQFNLSSMIRLADEFLPPQYRRRRDLLDRWLAVAWMHFPAMDPQGRLDGDSLPLQGDLSDQEIRRRWQTARRRLAWEEALLFQLGLAVRRQERQTRLRAVPLVCDERIRQRILARFPFALTEAQLKAANQIAADMARPAPMNRLLQGDVGSGKTAVALFAALLAVAHRHQAAIMAPTELLASQHFERIRRYLEGSRVRFALLTGSLTAARRREVHEQMAAGELDLVVGTTALLSRGVRFARLALAVIDEQHKFGVQQRSGLKEKGGEAKDEGRGTKGEGTDSASWIPLDPRPSALDPRAASTVPHVLVMTATPIPRSLALTVFGDLAVSIIDQSPPGRGRIDTRVVSPTNRDAALSFIISRLERGGQAYFVCPRIGGDRDESADEVDDLLDVEQDAKALAPSAEQVYRLLEPELKRFSVGLVHGRMAPEQQQAVLGAFAAGKIRALVATTVVEVGVDVPTANVMAVLGAERFGLAQLHQLRGRIGRGGQRRSYCLLFIERDGESVERLKILEGTRDGFRIAEEDLARRGPGQFFGVAQHGLPEFVHVNLATDLELLRQARQDAFALVRSDPALSTPRHVALRRQMFARFGRTLELVDTG